MSANKPLNNYLAIAKEALFGLCMLTFFFPFISGENSIGVHVEITGIELVLGKAKHLSELPAIWVTLTLVMAVSGFIYTFPYFNGFTGFELLFSVAGMLFMVLFKLGFEYRTAPDDVREIAFCCGYWLQLIFFTLSALIDIKKMTIRQKRVSIDKVNSFNINIITQIHNPQSNQNEWKAPNRQFPSDNQIGP